MRHDAQFNLAVIGACDHVASSGDKCFAHLAALGRAYRDILEIGVIAGQAPCHCNRLRIVGVHPSRFSVGHLGQFVGVGAFELA